MPSASQPRLLHRDGRLLLDRPDAAGKPTPVEPLRPLPLTDPDTVVFVDDDGQDVWHLDPTVELDAESRALLTAALEERYYMPRIERVTGTRTMFGTHYWEVETDRGPASFALREPGKNVTWLTPSHCMIRDTVGNRFEIPDLAALDPTSRRRILSIL